MKQKLEYEGWDDPMVLHVCAKMRAVDREEIFCQRADDDAWGFHRELAFIGARHLWFELARPREEILPVAFFGVVATGPGIGSAHLAGTDDLTLDHARQIAARIRQEVIPTMLECGLHRVEALSLKSHRWAHRFLKSAGARVEGERLAMGRDREDFLSFVWLADEIQQDAGGGNISESNARVKGS